MEDLSGVAMRASKPEKSADKTGAFPETVRPIGVDLFAGVGGLSLGFEQAGFDIAAAVEIDPVHSAVHEFNFPNCRVIPKSVSSLSGSEVKELAGLRGKEIDVVFGGAPCQGFSLIGHRALDDPRNALVKDFVRLVAELNPKFAVFENVKGLTVGKHRQFLDELVDALRNVGYRVRTPWQVLNAADFGIPQHRERLILLAARQGIPLPSYPSPSTFPADDQPTIGLPAGPTCSDALEDIPDADSFDELLDDDQVQVKNWKPRSDYARELHCTEPKHWHFGYVRNWNPDLLTSSARTEHTEISKRRFFKTPGGEVEPISRFLKLSAGGLSNTLRAGTDASRGAFTSPRPIHYERARCVTVREMARLHGFPDWFRFHVTKWHGARQIGNSVAPPLARAIAGELLRAIEYRPARPTKKIDFGDAKLLRMDVSEAAAYFGVLNPIAPRNSKSGARKRKQADIEASLEGAIK